MDGWKENPVKQKPTLSVVSRTGENLPPAAVPVTGFPDRKPRPAGPAPWARKEPERSGPTRPEVDRPDNKELLKKMRRVDPNQAKRYRQRTGQ